MNIYAPHRYNKDTGKYEPEVYPSIASLVFLPDGGNVYDEIKSIKEQLEDLNTALEQLSPEIIIVSSTAPDGDAKKLWINSTNSVAFYFNGSDWKPVAGTAV